MRFFFVASIVITALSAIVMLLQESLCMNFYLALASGCCGLLIAIISGVYIRKGR